MSTRKQRGKTDNGEAGTGECQTFNSSSGNGMDLGPIVRQTFETGRPESLLLQLKSVVDKKQVEIEDLCKTHYEGFIVAVDELRCVLVDADDLKAELSTENFRLQDIGTSSLSKLDEFIDSSLTKKNISDAIKMSTDCIKVLELCQKCNTHISEGKFYHALKVVNLLEVNRLQALPVKALRRLIEQRLPLVKLQIESKICGEVNEWLVHIRTATKDIGNAAMSCLNAGENDDNSLSGSALKFDLTPLHRAQHIHGCLGLKEKFREYYYNNRKLQLISDLELTLAQPFLECYRSFVAHVVGYFIVEDRVLRTVVGLLSHGQVEAMWEMAIAKITSVLEEQFSYIDSAEDLLSVKDCVTLLASTLKRHGYHIVPLLRIVEAGMDRYNELLFQDCRIRISKAISDDSYDQMVIKTEADYEEKIAAFELHTLAVAPAFPYITPFSSMIPAICGIVYSFITNSARYASHSTLPDSLHARKKCLDNLLIDIVNESMLEKIQSRSTTVSQAIQIAANVAFLEATCDLFNRRTALLCGVSARAAERPRGGLAAKVVLKTSRDAAYIALLGLVESKVDVLMDLGRNVDWTTEETPNDGNEYMGEVIVYLDTVMSMAQQILPPDALYKVGSGALEHISSTILAAFYGDTVTRFNRKAVEGIEKDVRTAEEYAEEKYRSTGLIEVYGEEGGLSGCLVEARQLLNLLLSTQPESFLNPVIRQRHYYTVDHNKLASVCDKFRDSPDRLFPSLSSRTSKHSALKRRLKDFSSS